MTAMATEKMGVMATGGGVHIVTAMATEKIKFLLLRSVNEPSEITFLMNLFCSNEILESLPKLSILGKARLPLLCRLLLDLSQFIN